MSLLTSRTHHDDKTAASVTDVIMVIDAHALLSQGAEPSREPDTPTVAEAKCCYVIVPNAPKQMGRNSGEILLNVPNGTYLRIRPTTMSMRAEYSAMLTNIKLANENTLTKPELKVDDDITIRRPATEDSSLLEEKQVIDCYWGTCVLSHGAVDAHVDVMVTDREANVLGCFRLNMNFSV
ncbi:hypothetical protein EO087_09370 [Dyella sp. M7H15-1]|uniref:AidA/PixA family protein n=1 Tax=Dyella sp. M7H15-1 TaxID=2501295 RepID=UPI001004EC26|nr:AidA/PixA family protein [Dyella sp. M7H15-1]QAU24171.1 hypothetical protein EO087_09370 [Dyella sp. M7H15-1]